MTVRRVPGAGRDEQNSAYGPATPALHICLSMIAFPSFGTGVDRVLTAPHSPAVRRGRNFPRALGLVVLVAAAGCARTGPSAGTRSDLQPPPRVRFVPDTARYRVASHLRVEQELGNQPQVSRLSLVYLLSVALAPGSSPGELKAEITVDSVARYEGVGAVSQASERARGLRFTGILLPTGELRDLQGANSADPLLGEIVRDVREFFPRLPAAGVASGDSWTDTTEQEITSGDVPLTMHSVAAHLVGERIEEAAGPVLPIRTLTRYTFSGAGRQGGQEFSVEGSGRRHTIEYLSLEGRYRGLVAADTSEFTIAVAATGLTIPGRQFRADTVKALP
ncbi:hypothetical protein HRbin33_00945 [bacterium HR33]|nr:hypothetical protein HRbin33_00945 [bacterium HR33]